MSRRKDREKAAKRTAELPVWEAFTAKVQTLDSLEDAERVLADWRAAPPAPDTYKHRLHLNLEQYISSGFKRPSGAEPKEGRLYRIFFRSVASNLTPEQRAGGAAELSTWLGDT